LKSAGNRLGWNQDHTASLHAVAVNERVSSPRAILNERTFSPYSRLAAKSSLSSQKDQQRPSLQAQGELGMNAPSPVRSPGAEPSLIIA
jgi:carbamoylphosphate synthase large subunit